MYFKNYTPKIGWSEFIKHLYKSFKQDWNAKIIKFERNITYYENLKEFYKKYITWEWESPLTGTITLITAILGAVSPLFPTFNLPEEISRALKYPLIVCEWYCGFRILSFLVLLYYKRKSDCYVFISKLIKGNVEFLFIQFDCCNNNFEIKEVGSPNHPECVKNLRDITDLGVYINGTSAIDPAKRLYYYTTLQNVRPDILTLITDKKGESIAGFNTIPLKENANEHYNKDVSQFEITRTLIAKGKSSKIFVQNICIKPKYLENSDSLLFVLKSFYNKLATMLPTTEKKLGKAIIYVEPTTPHNKRLFEALGFQYFGRVSKDGNKFLELNFANTKGSKKAWRSIMILRDIIMSNENEGATKLND